MRRAPAGPRRLPWALVALAALLPATAAAADAGSPAAAEDALPPAAPADAGSPAADPVARPSPASPGAASPSPAAPAPAPGPALPRRRVVVMAGQDFRVDPGALFVEGEPGPRPDAGRALSEAAVAELSREPELQVLRASELRPRSDPGGSPELVVRGLLHLGQERYRDLRIPEALAVLEQGIAAARKSYLDVLAPDLVSDLHLYQGLCQAELGRGALAHVAFKGLFQATPQRRFRKGWFPPATEEALRAAAEDFLRTAPQDNLLGSVDRAEAFVREARASALVVASLTGAPGEPGRVIVRVAEASAGAGGHLGLAARAEGEWRGAEDAAWQVSRALTAWLACTSLPSREVAARAKARFFLDTSAAYALFLKVPTRRIFSNAGFGLGLAWQAREGLDVFGRLNLMDSFPDPYGDLVKGFWTIRTTLGVGYSMRFDWGRVFLHTGLMFDYLSGFEATTDPNCKFWPGDPDLKRADGTPLCPASRVTRPRWLVGGLAALGVNVNLAGPLYMLVQAAVGAHFISNEADTPLNFPFSLELGIGYAFP